MALSAWSLARGTERFVQSSAALMSAWPIQDAGSSSTEMLAASSTPRNASRAPTTRPPFQPLSACSKRAWAMTLHGSANPGSTRVASSSSASASEKSCCVARCRCQSPLIVMSQAVRSSCRFRITRRVSSEVSSGAMRRKISDAISDCVRGRSAASPAYRADQSCVSVAVSSSSTVSRHEPPARSSRPVTA